MMDSGLGLSLRHAKWLWIAWILAAAAVLLLAVESAAGAWGPATAGQGGAVIYVDDSAVGGANNGSSWANAFLDLQDALKVAQAGDEIRIGQGTYKPAPPSGDRAISFNLVSGVVMQGGYAGFGASNPDALDHVAFPTILSGDLNGNDQPNFINYADNSLHIITAIDVSSETVLSGIVITAGSADLAQGDCFQPLSGAIGGGLLCVNANLALDHCVITRNQARCAGGGMSLAGGSPTLTGCRFESNRMSQGSTDSFGGGYSGNGSPTFFECDFIDNRNSWYGGAARVSGGRFQSCTFRFNQSWEFGGAVFGDGFTMLDCTIDQNGAGNWVAGVHCSDADIINCTFTRNQSAMCSTYPGTALRAMGSVRAVNCLFAGNSGSSPTIGLSEPGNALINCTIVGNNVPFCSPAGVRAAGNALVRNVIIWGNVDEPGFVEQAQIMLEGSATIRDSCVQGWTGSLGGIGNHGNDPRFVDADGPDNIYGTADDNPRLLANSPCIDSGESALLPADQFDLDEDGDTTEPLPIDLDGLPRVVGANVDMGAYEFQGAPCRADIDGNGSVAVNDLLAVITTWGPCIPGQVCNGDLNLDGQVAVNDLLAVITTWGDCP